MTFCVAAKRAGIHTSVGICFTFSLKKKVKLVILVDFMIFAIEKHSPPVSIKAF
jgi:hypothetical protein